jgi:hypothetical protein
MPQSSGPADAGSHCVADAPRQGRERAIRAASKFEPDRFGFPLPCYESPRLAPPSPTTSAIKHIPVYGAGDAYGLATPNVKNCTLNYVRELGYWAGAGDSH